MMIESHIRPILLNRDGKGAGFDHSLRRAVRLVAVLNLAYFGIEFAVTRVIGSVSLFADSIDFLTAKEAVSQFYNRGYKIGIPASWLHRL
jgi:hypothetical protein